MEWLIDTGHIMTERVKADCCDLQTAGVVFYNVEDGYQKPLVIYAHGTWASITRIAHQEDDDG